MSFQSDLETFQCQFWICNVIGQGVPHGWSRDTEASWPEATCPGSRCGEVSPCRRTKVGSGRDFRNGEAGSTEICWAMAMEWVPYEGCNFENDALADGKPVKLIPKHRRDVVKFPCVCDQSGRRVENGLQSSQDSVQAKLSLHPVHALDLFHNRKRSRAWPSCYSETKGVVWCALVCTERIRKTNLLICFA